MVLCKILILLLVPFNIIHILIKVHVSISVLRIAACNLHKYVCKQAYCISSSSRSTLKLNRAAMRAYVTRYEKTDHFENFAKIAFMSLSFTYTLKQETSSEVNTGLQDYIQAVLFS